MKLKAITTEEILNADCKNYNPSEWVKTIDRYSKYGKVQFYQEIESPFDYERFFVTYQIPEGIIFLTSVSYSSSLTNNGFVRVAIDPTTGEVKTFEFSNGEKTGRADNSPANRKLFAKMSIVTGAIFSNEI